MTINDFVSTNEILSDVLLIVGDEKLDKGITKGWYISQIQQALEELSFDTFFDKKTLDLDVNDTLSIRLPDNCFNIREIYLHNGVCGGKDTVIVHHKRLFNNKPNGKGYSALRKDDTTNSTDPFYSSNTYEDRVTLNDSSNIHYYSVQNGIVMLSNNCSNYTKIRIVCNGMGGGIGDEPVIPRFFRQAVKDYVVYKTWEVKKSADRLASVNWRDSNAILQDSWRKARIRVTSMDSKQKESLRTYWSRGNW